MPSLLREPPLALCLFHSSPWNEPTCCFISGDWEKLPTHHIHLAMGQPRSVPVVGQGDAAPSLGHSPCGLVSLQKQFPSRQEKSYPGWVQAICGLLSFLPALLVPGVAMAQLPIWRRRKQENMQQNMHLKLQVGYVSNSEVR